MKPIGVGVIGASPAGGWAALAHVPALQALPEFESLAVGRDNITLDDGTAVEVTSPDQIAVTAALRSGFDHFYPIAGDPAGPCLEGWTTLTALAQATTRLRLGTLVTGVHYRHPAVLANMAAALDIISGGRLELGIGAGWNELESGAYGIELGTVKERMDRFEEATEVLIGLLSQETTNFDGDFYRLKEARNEPKGPQRPHPPICMGGSGEKRTLRIVAKYADHWNFVIGTPGEFAHKRDVLWSHCTDLGRNPAEITLSAHVWVNPEHDHQKVLAEVAGFAEEGLDLAILYLPPPLDPSALEPLATAIADSGLHVAAEAAS